MLAGHARTLDEAYREVGARLAAEDTAVSLDDDGRLHVERLKAIPDPPSLVDLRRRVRAMLPRVDLPEVILEVMAWEPRFVEAFTAASGGPSRIGDLHVTIAACLTAHALNIGFDPIVRKGVEALERDRVSHVNQTYLGTETYSPANGWLIGAQGGIPLAQAWGGGLVAAVDGMRFVVPVPSVYARPNRKYFGPKRGVTWLNMINDQGAGLGAKVVSGTPRDSLHFVDVAFSQDGGQRPDIIVADTGSYSDLVFGLVQLLDMEYRPALADLPDQRLWHIDPAADYGLLTTAARGRIDLARVRRHWPDILRVVASVYTGTVRAYDVVLMLQRDGHPTPLGDAIAGASPHLPARNSDSVKPSSTPASCPLGRHLPALRVSCLPSPDPDLAPKPLPLPLCSRCRRGRARSSSEEEASRSFCLGEPEPRPMAPTAGAYFGVRGGLRRPTWRCRAT